MSKLSDLGAKLLGLRTCREETVGPPIRVPEWLRDPLEADREGTQRGGAGGLDAAERATLTRPKRHRDEDEREQHEHTHDETAAKRTRAA